MNTEKNKNIVWRLEDQKWWQEYSKMVQREKNQNQNADWSSPVNEEILKCHISGSSYVSSGRGLFIHSSNYGSGFWGSGSGLFIHSSNLYGSGYLGTGSGAYGSGLYIHGSNTAVYGSGLYIHGSNTAAYGSGLYIHGSNATAYDSDFSTDSDTSAIYGELKTVPEDNKCTVEYNKVMVPDYLRNTVKNITPSSNTVAGILAYGIDLI